MAKAVVTTNGLDTSVSVFKVFEEYQQLRNFLEKEGFKEMDFHKKDDFLKAIRVFPTQQLRVAGTAPEQLAWFHIKKMDHQMVVIIAIGSEISEVKKNFLQIILKKKNIVVRRASLDRAVPSKLSEKISEHISLIENIPNCPCCGYRMNIRKSKDLYEYICMLRRKHDAGKMVKAGFIKGKFKWGMITSQNKKNTHHRSTRKHYRTAA